MNLRQVFTGYLGGDCREFTANNGREGLSFSLAVNNGRDKNGNDRDPLWINCTIWDPAEGLAKWLEKGVPVVVEGILVQPSGWVTEDMVMELLQKSYPDHKSLATAISQAIRDHRTTRVELLVTRVVVYGKRGVKNLDTEVPTTTRAPQTRNTAGINFNVGTTNKTTADAGVMEQMRKFFEQAMAGNLAGSGDDIPF